MKTILAPIDFSTASDAVVKEAAALARALNGRVVVMTVIQPPTLASEYVAMIQNFAEVMAAGEKAAAKQLGEIESRLKAGGVPVDVIQLNGVPVPLIVDQAGQLSADYVVMGSHGHSAVYDLLMGSTTHGVLMRVGCPVVIVPPSAAKPPRSRK